MSESCEVQTKETREAAARREREMKEETYPTWRKRLDAGRRGTREGEKRWRRGRDRAKDGRGGGETERIRMQIDVIAHDATARRSNTKSRIAAGETYLRGDGGGGRSK